jgi:membrane protein YqaA with SNARE-associated domain
MWEEILKAFPIYLLTMLKVVFGPTMGYAAGLHIVTSMLVTFLGMMTSVVLVTFFGKLLHKGVLKKWFEKQEQSAATSKWKKYGLTGLAILTPLLLTPIGGSILAVAGGYSRPKIIVYMLISASLFAVIATGIIYYFGPQILPDFVPR